ncbi:MAG: hypothetical protein WCD70_08845 [Alphaproteobacteria bacterium]
MSLASMTYTPNQLLITIDVFQSLINSAIQNGVSEAAAENFFNIVLCYIDGGVLDIYQ